MLTSFLSPLLTPESSDRLSGLKSSASVPFSLVDECENYLKTNIQNRKLLKAILMSPC